MSLLRENVKLTGMHPEWILLHTLEAFKLNQPIMTVLFLTKPCTCSTACL